MSCSLKPLGPSSEQSGLLSTHVACTDAWSTWHTRKWSTVLHHSRGRRWGGRPGGPLRKRQTHSPSGSCIDSTGNQRIMLCPNLYHMNPLLWQGRAPVHEVLVHLEEASCEARGVAPGHIVLRYILYIYMGTLPIL